MLSMTPALAASLDPGIVARFAELSLSAPTTQSLIICHGFGCKYRTEIGLSAADHKQLAKLLAAGRASPEAERQAVGKAVAWFQRRVAPEAGTAKAIARAGPSKSGDPSQFDCIDASTNTTDVLLVLEQLQLLRHHDVIGPSSRLSLVGHVSFHSTAVLAERRSGRKWAVDSWTRPNGEVPDIMPLETWSASN
jgi:hypothetical protein